MFYFTAGEVILDSNIDFETATSHSIDVIANDGNLDSTTETLTINIDNVNEAPVFDNLPHSFNINEDTTTGTTVYTVGSTDPEGDAVTYRLSAASSFFSIDTNSNMF